MVTQNMLRTNEGGLFEEKFRFMIALDLIECLEQIKLGDYSVLAHLLLSYLPIQVPFSIY